jgi:hypothetical protein
LQTTAELFVVSHHGDAVNPDPLPAEPHESCGMGNASNARRNTTPFARYSSSPPD